ncbi:unnamed protein product [Trifolium pratense]|uniref:Uncharacterized protein n=1 Tax=Trifolium pratense TaxID=57577 RepID=A0ACB0JJZ1_TRIPR|nr:unnamed protein product [Trifolium pratense]
MICETADKNDLEGMLNMKIQDLDIVEELRIKRADKHGIVNYEDLEIAIACNLWLCQHHLGNHSFDS